MEQFSPVILTSKQATNHFNKIKMEHSDLLTNMQTQQMKIEQYNQQKSIEKQQEDEQNRTMQVENQKMNMENQKMQTEAEAKKLAEINKAKELEIKAQALSSD